MHSEAIFVGMCGIDDDVTPFSNGVADCFWLASCHSWKTRVLRNPITSSSFVFFSFAQAAHRSRALGMVTNSLLRWDDSGLK
jgi:hypothetical protein